MGTIQAEHPRPRHFLLHVSDTHLLGDGLLAGSLDAEARVRRVFEQMHDAGGSPEAIVVTGDLADRGEPEAYVRLRGIAEPAAEALGARLIWAMGNHDSRSALRTHLLGEDPSSEPLDRVHWVKGLRIIVLDSSVPGFHHGELSSAQLEWLAEELTFPAPDGTILAMHHPPVPSVQELAVLVELRGQAALADVLRGSDVRAILAGHLHYSTSGTFAGIPVSVASATCYTQDLAGGVDRVSGFRETRGRDAAQAYNLVHVYADTVLHSVVPAAGGGTVGREVGGADVARLLAEAGVSFPADDGARPVRRGTREGVGPSTGMLPVV
ncbi:3',5'-cyclic adenosine monophosphate phosphodiesterase CpdA [Sinomonas notoginsengisoli]|uniref:phosphodiesterase n=1 Tax=Sinomonas notoginsengisoli TaxID=1457311 RepID=UPI001F16C787|nr:phosphodiesterase [Sinomonas notoginsengisoli]